MAESSKSSASLPAQKHEQSLKPPDNMSCPPCAQSQPQELSSLSSGPEKKPSVSWGTPMSTGRGRGRGRARGRGLSLIVSAPGMDAALNTSPENQKKLGGLGDFLSRPPASNTQTQVSEKPMGTYADYVELASGAEPHDIPRTAEGQTTTHNQLLSQLDNSSSPSFVTESLTTSVSTQHSHNEPNIPTQLLSPTSMAADVSLSPSAPDIKHPSSDSEPGTVLLFSSLPPSWSASKLEGFCESLGEVVTVISVNMKEEGRARAVLSGLTSEEISLAITKPCKFSIALGAVATQSNITTEVSNSIETIFSTGELSSSYPESSAKASVTVTDKVSFSPSFSSDNLCVPSAQTDTVTSQLPNLMHQDEQLLLQETTHSIFFSSLPSEVNKGELEVFCGMLGENIEIKSLDILRGGKGRAIVCGLTTEEISIVEKKICKMKGSVISIKFESASKVNSPSSQGAILVVKNLPDNCQPEVLEMYFENPKSGGTTGCVEDIKIVGGTVANVKFRTPEDAASVFAKGGHFFLNKSLKLEYLQSHEKVQEYELDKLFLQMIPVTTSDELLQYYLSNQLKIDIDEFNVRRLSDKAVVTFRKTFSIKEFEEVIAKICRKPLEGATIKAELYKTCTSIRLSNVTESSQYTEEFIKYYFTSKKSAVKLKNNVDKVVLLGDGMAVIHFENPEDVQAVFSHSHSSIFGQDVVLELNDQLCIAKHQMHNSSMDLSKSSNSKKLDTDSRFKTFKLKLKPIVILSLNNDRSILDQCSKKLHVTVDIDIKKGHIMATPTVQTPANWQTRWEAQAKNFVKEKISFHENVQIPKECITDLLAEFSNIQVESRSFVHKFSDNNVRVSIAGEKGIVDYAKKKIQELVEQYTITTTTIPLDKQDFDFIAKVKLTTIIANYPQLQFNLQAETSSLTVKGTIRDTQEFSQALDEVKYHVKVPIPVKDHICTYLQRTGNQKLHHSFEKKYSLAVHFVPGNLAVFFLCEPNNRESANTAVQRLCEETTIFKDGLPKSFISLRDSLEDFDQLCNELENQNTVNIVITQTELMIVGFQDGVQRCKTNLLEYIKEKCTIEVPVPIEVGIWRLLKKYMIGKWTSIIAKYSHLQVVCKEPPTDEEECVITFIGDRFHVDQVCNELSALQSSISKRNIEKNQPGTCAYFRSKKTRKILNGIEAGSMVIIEVTEAEEEETGLSIHNPLQQKFDKKCTAFLPKGGKKLIVYVGDITEFDQADVIVNAANEDLKHIGGLALAIANKGGPVIQNDSNSYVKKRGKIDTGNVWLTENVGLLPCRAIVHAVGPRWSGGYAKEEALLRKVCLQSLQNSHYKFSSISFPAISSGVYGFPLDRCAQTMVKAFIEYSQRHSASKLQDIYLVLFKQSDSSVFISALKSHLPSSSVHIEQPHAAEPLQPQLSLTPQTRPASKGRRKKANSSASYSPIKLHKGGLLDVKADAYVNSTNPKLDLTQGAVARALYKAGGKQLQAECTTKAPLQVGEVAVTGPGKIACQYIVHTVLPNFDGTGDRAQKVLRKSIQSCLQECSKVNLTSVAFPAIGTGNLGFPNDLAAKIMVEEVLQYFSFNPQSSINTVHLVIFMQDTYQAFQKELQAAGSQATDSPIEPTQLPLKNQSKRHVPRRVKYTPTTVTSAQSETNTWTIGNVSVNIIHGDIGEESTDVIVVPTNTTMKLAGQGVAGAILKKGGQELQMVCDTMVANGVKLTEGKVVTTPVTGALKAKTLFHIVFESKDDKKFIKVISACLQEAEKNLYQSISFPAIGTGIYGYPPQVAALGMFRAIKQNASKLKYVKLIRIVLFPIDVYTTFGQVFRNPAEYETPGLLDKAKNFIESALSASPWSSTPEVATPVEMNTEDDAVVIRLYGETEMQVSNAEMEIEKLIEDTFIAKEVESKMVDKLSENETDRLMKQARELHVGIDIDPDPLNTIKIKGDETNVHKMYCFAVELLSEVEKNEKRKQEAETCHKTIRWSRMDSNDEEEEYDVEENYEIESAYRDRGGKGSYRHINPMDGTDFTINFDQYEEIDHNKNNTKCNVKRTDLLKKIQEEVPKDWAKMPINSTTGKEELVHMVTLDKQCQEYSDVKRMFDATMQQQKSNHPTQQLHTLSALGAYSTNRHHNIKLNALGVHSTNHQLYNSIIKIERIQNPTLYAQYMARKKEMDKQNPQGHQNERRLFHGTKPDTCPQINHGGFNRSYCGQNATVYGKGVYFARDAEYSARDTYSPCDGNGYKYIYLARVLTGEFTRGSGGMLVPPPKDSSNAHHTYDSVVDNVATPGIFVVFQDAQNYPEYLITFQ